MPGWLPAQPIALRTRRLLSAPGLVVDDDVRRRELRERLPALRRRERRRCVVANGARQEELVAPADTSCCP